MDLGSQEKIKKLADEHAQDELLVVLGAPDDEAAEIAAETIIFGDPTYAGALTETQLGLDVYHVLEDEIKSEIPDDVWEEQVGVMADTLEAEDLAKAVRDMRSQEEGGEQEDEDEDEEKEEQDDGGEQEDEDEDEEKEEQDDEEEEDEDQEEQDDGSEQEDEDEEGGEEQDDEEEKDG